MGHDRQLTLHIGLPKTATTTLQTHVFPMLPGYVGKFYGESPNTAVEEPFRQFQKAYEQWTEGKSALTAPATQFIESLDRFNESQILISEEGLYRWPVDGRVEHGWPFFDGWHETFRARPHPVVDFLAALREAGEGRLKVRVILTLRNQSDFMGSLYAQLQNSMRKPSQNDFEAKVTRALSTDDPFFDYATLVEELEQDLGDGDLLILLYEDGLELNVSRIAEFLGIELVAPHSSRSRENVKRHGSQSWKGAWVEKPVTKRGPLGRIRRAAARTWPDALRVLAGPLKRALKRLDAASESFVKPQTREGVVITMPDRLAREVREHYADSNERLAQTLERDLKSLGY